MGFWSSLANNIFGWSNSARSRYDAETQNKTEQQRHERLKDMENLRHNLSIEKADADAKLAILKQEATVKALSDIQELEQQDLEFRRNFATSLTTVIQKIQTDHLAQITSMILGYKSEHLSTIKELELFYADKAKEIRIELKGEDDIDIRGLLVEDYKSLRERGKELTSTLIKRIDRDIETMQLFIVEYEKSKGLNVNLLIDRVIGSQLNSEDRVKLLQGVNDVLNTQKTIEAEDAIIVEYNDKK